MKEIYFLAVEATIDAIGGKWKPIILCHLGNGTLRTGELRKKIPNISQRILTKQLRELESDNLIIRHEFSQVPPKVEYRLSDEGKSLRNVLLAMSDWGKHLVDYNNNKGNHIAIENNNQTGFDNM